MTTIAYARVSTQDQHAGLAAQDRDLRAAGADRVISEQVSSLANRPGLKEALAAVGPGDVLMVTKPDRLARNTAHLLQIVDDLTKRGVGLVILSMGGERLDTRNPTSRLILTIMGAVAEFERTLMLERQREGVARAKADGKYRGRVKTIDTSRVKELAGEFGYAVAAREMGISVSSVYRHTGRIRIRRPEDGGIPL